MIVNWQIRLDIVFCKEKYFYQNYQSTSCLLLKFLQLLSDLIYSILMIEEVAHPLKFLWSQILVVFIITIYDVISHWGRQYNLFGLKSQLQCTCDDWKREVSTQSTCWLIWNFLIELKIIFIVKQVITCGNNVHNSTFTHLTINEYIWLTSKVSGI